MIACSIRKSALWCNLTAAFLMAVLMCLMSCRNDSSGFSGQTNALFVGIDISPQDNILTVGDAFLYRAYAVYSDNNKVLITKDVAWGVTDSTVAQIDKEGNLTAKSSGKVGVTAEYEGKKTSSVLTVKDASLVKLTITPENATLHLGERHQLSATGVYSDNSVEDLTDKVTWLSHSPEFVEIDAKGLVQAHGVGTSQIDATSKAKPFVTASTKVSVSPASLVAISIEPNEANIHLDQEKRFIAEGFYSDGKSADITDQAQWSTLDEKIAQVDSKENLGKVTGKGEGSTKIQIVYQEQSDTASITVNSAVLQKIIVSPENATLHLGEHQQYYATGVYSDQTVDKLDEGIRWASSNPDAIVINQKGVAQSLSGGESTITAMDLETAIKENTSVNVDISALQDLTLLPKAVMLHPGIKKQLVVSGKYTDGVSKDLTLDATWGVADDSIAALTIKKGEVIGKASGSTQVTATFDNKIASTKVDVTEKNLDYITLSPRNFTLPEGVKKQYQADAFYSDGSFEQVTDSAIWSVIDHEAASIEKNAGLLTAKQKGETQVLAHFGGRDGATTVTVIDASLEKLTITPDSADINFVVGQTNQLTANGQFSDGELRDVTTQVIWLSQSPDVLSVTPEDAKAGEAAAVGEGNADIKVVDPITQKTASMTYEVKKAMLEGIEISPEHQILDIGDVYPYLAKGIYSNDLERNLTQSVKWVADPNFAQIDADGRLTALSPVENTGVTAEYQGVKNTALLTIKKATLQKITVTPDNLLLHDGERHQLSATGVYSDNSVENLTDSVTWHSHSPEFVEIDTKGLVQAQAVGASQIDATSKAGTSITATTSVTVSPASLVAISIEPNEANIHLDQEKNFIAEGVYSDGKSADITDQAQWNTLDEKIAQVDPKNPGKVTGQGEGSTKVQIAYQEQSDSVSITVNKAVLQKIVVAPDNAKLHLGEHQQYYATGVYSDQTVDKLDAGIRWASANSEVITINGKGLAQSLKVGSSKITVTENKTGISSASVPVNVDGAILQNFSIVPDSVTLNLGVNKQLMARGQFTDGTTKDLTQDAQWSVDSDNFVELNDKKGEVTAKGVGSATVTTIFDAKLATAKVDVIQKSLDRITIRAESDTLPKGTTQNYVATAHYTDDSTDNITNATWSVRDPEIALIDKNTGQVTAKKQGSTQVMANFGGKSAVTSLTVSDAKLEKLTIIPDNTEIDFIVGDKKSLAAGGIYSDGEGVDVTKKVLWFSESPAVLTVIPEGDDAGQAHPVGPGSAAIIAVHPKTQIRATMTYQVTQAALNSIEITPKGSVSTPTNLPIGNPLSLTATGKYSDGKSRIITQEVEWRSDDSSIAAVAQSGIVSAIKIGGLVNISANLQNLSDSTSIDVVNPSAVASITITPKSVLLAPLKHKFLKAVATFNSGDTLDVTKEGRWVSTDWIIASISNWGDWSGRVYASGTEGTCTIKFTYGNQTVDIPVTVK